MKSPLSQRAAGSVGAYAVQLAHRSGAHVIATAGTRDLGYVRGLGADTVVDYHASRFEDVAHDVDAVLDIVGSVTAAFFLVEVTAERLTTLAN